MFHDLRFLYELLRHVMFVMCTRAAPSLEKTLLHLIHSSVLMFGLFPWCHQQCFSNPLLLLQIRPQNGQVVSDPSLV